MVTARSGRHTDRSSITFGPVGRTLWTLSIVALPLPLLAFGGGFTGWGFAALWWSTVTPWALRDLWRSGRKRHVL